VRQQDVERSKAGAEANHDQDGDPAVHACESFLKRRPKKRAGLPPGAQTDQPAGGNRPKPRMLSQALGLSHERADVADSYQP
jgi:hypothetical protein